jgi:cytochrome oxidase Cu insertion factor (SCO1/SenC/PrrC family)
MFQGQGLCVMDVSGGSSRREAFARGAPGIPRKFVAAALALFVVLGAGGVLLERALSSAGLNPDGGASADAPAQPSAAYPPPLSGGPGSAASAASFSGASEPIGAGGAAVLGLTSLKPAAAPDVVLTGPTGEAVDLAAMQGKVVVLSFFDAACDDICPVLGSEILAADAALGPAASSVEFVTINTDPLADQVAPPAKVFGGKAAPANWVFVSGSLKVLDRVWAEYLVTVDVSKGPGKVTHNDLMYFVDPRGILRYRATPFADEDLTGRWTLPAPVVSSWGAAMAATARDLLR